MNPNADPRMATVLSGISRLVADFGDQGALTLILQNDAGKALLDSMQNVSRAASMLEKGPPIPLFAMTGPTGVGKTSLLNAILQQEVADVSWRRPTTIEPLLHLFGSQPVAELPENIRNCPSAPHDIDFLFNMLIVDMPDLNMVDATVGLRSESLLEQADVVLIVGSPEQYGNQSV
ncbi:MAG: GTPase, partial [Planctomycetota bacterium]